RRHVKLTGDYGPARERVERIQIETWKCPVVPGCVEIAGRHIQERAGGAGDFRIKKGLVSVSQDERALVIGPNGPAAKPVIPLGEDCEKAAISANAIASGPQVKHAVLLQFLETCDTFGLKILEEFGPGVVISLAQKFD